ncbi:glycosyltransferase [Streptomyces sanglieri]|uniref:Glycosyltransferase n=1 Tax=Streptomyces sanglieri TaxID=193460 RepID=A0ABW2WLJ1_9ACTN
MAALGPAPSSVRVVENVPLAALLPGSAAVVHHGGSGSTLTALWAGVPQFIATFASEQQVTGERVAATGTALHVPGHLADEAAIRAAVERLVEDGSYRAAAGRLREEVAETPPPAALAVRLEELVAGG